MKSYLRTEKDRRLGLLFAGHLAFLLLLTLFVPLRTLPQSLSTDFPNEAPNSVNPSVSPHASLPRYNEFTFYSGQSFGYPQIMSDLDTQRLMLIGVRYTSHFHYFSHFTLNWNADLKPLALYSNDIYGHRKYTYGGGGSIGIQLVPKMHWRCTPSFDIDGGTLAFTRETPTPNSRRVNISLDFGPGLYIPVDDNRSIKVATYFSHFSNADTAPRNPAFDTFFLYLGFTFRNIRTPHFNKHSV